MILRGKGVCSGYAYGKISIYSRTESQVVRRKCKDVEQEIKRFDDARLCAKAQYEKLYDKAMCEVGSSGASLFRADIMLLDDMTYIESVINIIRSQHTNAECAVALTIDNFSRMIMRLRDDYIKDRASDVREVYNKVIAILSDVESPGERYDEPVIIFARDLTPSEIVRMDKTNILGFVMGDSNANSHAAILSRSMGIPSVVGADLSRYIDDDGHVSMDNDIALEFDGKMAIIDGFMGEVIVEPDENQLEKYRDKKQSDERNKNLLEQLKDKETVTLSGKKVHLYANINSESDVAIALKNDAEGIGLYRSEYLYMGRRFLPTEEEQVNVYKRIAENMGGKKVIIRTADIGTDKDVGYLGLLPEDNPALGYRGIRLSLDMREIFVTQLRAIYRASCYGNIAIMFPMITSLKEVITAKKLIEDIKDELNKEGYPYKDCEIGIMIETPAAVMISDVLAKEVDFFSIGTNDLSQYTLAIDRTDSRLDKFYNPYHDAILRQIKMTIENAHDAGCRVGICGEAASLEMMIPKLIEYGIDEMSVSPTSVLSVRDAIRKIQ